MPCRIDIFKRIIGKDKTQVQQKRYRYTGKERDDSRVRALGVVFAAFAEDMGADVQGVGLLLKNATATREKKEMTAAVYATTALDI
jgi:hypothetical protein